MEMLNIIGIAGSLREKSYNKMLLHEAIRLAPEGMEISVYDISDIPLYNQDMDNSQPNTVVLLKEDIRLADGVLLVTPEYNYSVSGVLKNVLDSASRPYGSNAWRGKPVGIMGASTGGFGTLRAQLHLREMFLYLEMRPMSNLNCMFLMLKTSLIGLGDWFNNFCSMLVSSKVFFSQTICFFYVFTGIFYSFWGTKYSNHKAPIAPAT